MLSSSEMVLNFDTLNLIPPEQRFPERAWQNPGPVLGSVTKRDLWSPVASRRRVGITTKVANGVAP